MRISPTAEWSSFATSISVLVLLTALLPISYVMRDRWLAPRPFMGFIGIPHDFVNPQPPYKSYPSLVSGFAPTLAAHFDGIPLLPAAIPKRLGSVEDLSAHVMAGQDRVEIAVMGYVPKLSPDIAGEFQWDAAGNAVPIFGVTQRTMDRATATGQILTMRTYRETAYPPATSVGTILLDGRPADVSYQPIADTEIIRWTQGSWSVSVHGRSSQFDEVRRLALDVSSMLGRLTLPKAIGIADFSYDTPSSQGDLYWATSGGLLTAYSQIDPLLAIDVARSMSPLKPVRVHRR